MTKHLNQNKWNKGWFHIFSDLKIPNCYFIKILWVWKCEPLASQTVNKYMDFEP